MSNTYDVYVMWYDKRRIGPPDIYTTDSHAIHHMAIDHPQNRLMIIKLPQDQWQALTDTDPHMADKQVFHLITGNGPSDVVEYEALWGQYSVGTVMDDILALCTYFNITSTRFADFITWLNKAEEEEANTPDPYLPQAEDGRHIAEGMRLQHKTTGYQYDVYRIGAVLWVSQAGFPQHSSKLDTGIQPYIILEVGRD